MYAKSNLNGLKPKYLFCSLRFFTKLLWNMPKRKFSEVDCSNIGINKNSLDSDEEDNDSDGDRYELKDEDIEGQEEGIVGLEEGVQITPFNMKEEMEEGHFDNDGMYHWKKEKVAKDSWLENIDWIKVKDSESAKFLKSQESDDEMPDSVDINGLYKDILAYLQPKESIAKALKRLGGKQSLSASQRLKLKKSGIPLDEYNNGDAEKVTKLTELANKILTHAGNMDIYQETYEFISEKLKTVEPKHACEPELDMYADDFGEKEKERLTDNLQSSVKDDESSCTFSKSEGNDVMWEYKSKEDSTDIKGPFSSKQMEKWSNSGHFGSGVLVRKCGTEQFYTSNRIDFDLYI